MHRITASVGFYIENTKQEGKNEAGTCNEFIKVHGKQEVLRYGKYTKSSSNRMWVCRLCHCIYTDAEQALFRTGSN